MAVRCAGWFSPGSPGGSAPGLHQPAVHNQVEVAGGAADPRQQQRRLAAVVRRMVDGVAEQDGQVIVVRVAPGIVEMDLIVPLTLAYSCRKWCRRFKLGCSLPDRNAGAGS